MKLINRLGKRYGSLVVVERMPNSVIGSARWKYRCDCGTINVVRGSEFNRITSCGCVSWKRKRDKNGRFISRKTVCD